jgi:hypothetical protein
VISKSREVTVGMDSIFAGNPIDLSGPANTNLSSAKNSLWRNVPVIQCFHKSNGTPEIMDYEENADLFAALPRAWSSRSHRLSDKRFPRAVIRSGLGLAIRNEFICR